MNVKKISNLVPWCFLLIIPIAVFARQAKVLQYVELSILFKLIYMINVNILLLAHFPECRTDKLSGLYWNRKSPTFQLYGLMLTYSSLGERK